MDSALQIIGLEKRFGHIQALAGLSFSIPRGVTCAFVGANGAGKTTTFSLIGGFIRATRGEVVLEGKPATNLSRMEGQVGILPQDMRFFEERSLESQLSLFARLSGCKGGEIHPEVVRVLSAVGLLEKRSEPARALSRGMRVRLGVAQALIGSPPVVLLDEPLAGLDPMVRSQVKDVVRDLHGKTTVMVSSHELGELQSLCDYIVAIDKGQCVFAGPMEAALSRGERCVTYRLGALPSDLQELQSIVAPMSLITRDQNEFLVQFEDGKPSAVNALVVPWLLQQKIPIIEILYKNTLEEAYFQFIKDDADDNNKSL